MPHLPVKNRYIALQTNAVLRSDAMATIIDVKGPYAEVIEKLNMPPSFVILDRVVWGVSAILGKLQVTAPWRSMLLEYRDDGPPATPFGEAERAWMLRAHHGAQRPPR